MQICKFPSFVSKAKTEFCGSLTNLVLKHEMRSTSNRDSSYPSSRFKKSYGRLIIVDLYRNN